MGKGEIMAKFGIYPVEGSPGFYIVTGGMIRGTFHEAIKVAGLENAEVIRNARDRLANKLPGNYIPSPVMKAQVISKVPRRPESGTIWDKGGEIYILHSDNNSMRVAESNATWIRYQQGRKTHIEPVKNRYQLWVSKKTYMSVRREAERQSKKLLEKIKQDWEKGGTK